MKLAILFSGQGSQKTGMGLDFLENPIFKETIEKSSEACNQDLITVFGNEHEELNKTIHVQPALVAFEAGIFNMLKQDLSNLETSAMIGLSLGEYGAMYASEALSLENTISLVGDRAKYMQEDANKVENAMAALLKPNIDTVALILDKLQKNHKRVYLCNFNSPKQVVIGGESSAVQAAINEIIDNQAAHRVIKLKVNGAFHTPLFTNASRKMHDRLKNVHFSNSSTPVISNTTVKPFSNDWNEVMEKQLSHPTYFGDCVEYAIKNYGIDTTLEIGPGKTLSTFTKQIDRNITRYSIGNFDEYQTVVEEFNK